MSLIGIGSGQAPLEQCVALAQRPGVRQAWLSCQRLVIDEISMVEAELFDKLEAVARSVSACSNDWVDKEATSPTTKSPGSFPGWSDSRISPLGGFNSSFVGTFCSCHL